VFSWADLVIETYCEEELFREKGQVQGITKMLENKYGWRDVKHLSVEHKEEQKLILDLSGNPELAEKLARDAGGSISFEVRESKVVLEQ
jgi:hypothetical protein